MKGFWRMMESVLAVVIILGFLVTIGNVYLKTKSDAGAGPDIYAMLKELDARNELRPYASSMNLTALNSRIETPGYNHSIAICSFDGNCTGTKPEASNIIVSSYVISGYQDYAPIEIRVYVW